MRFRRYCRPPPVTVWDLAKVFASEPLTVWGGNDQDPIIGGPGNDTIDGGEGRDLIYSGDGNDLIYAKDNTVRWGDYIQPGLGNNTIIADAVSKPGWTDGHDLAFIDVTIAVNVNLKTGIASGAGMLTTFSHVHWATGGAGQRYADRRQFQLQRRGVHRQSGQ